MSTQLYSRFDFLEVQEQNSYAYPGLISESMLKCPIAGTTYREEIEKIEPGLRIGQVLFLDAEPDNPFDSRAIRVLTGSGVFLGYIPKSQNSELFRWLNQGGLTQVTLLRKRWLDTWLRLDIEVCRLISCLEQAA